MNSVDDPLPEGVLEAVARAISSTERPEKTSDIPAGSTYLAQFAVHDLDMPSRHDAVNRRQLNLAIIYGDGPANDASCYQVPERPGDGRYLLRIGRTRPTASSPAWGAARDLPRISCPHLDLHGSESRTEVLVPNAFSDSNLLLGQVQTIWALLHNAVASTLARTHGNAEVFDLARAVTLGIYRDVVVADVLNTWLMPETRVLFDGSASLPKAVDTSVEFKAGVARLGHHLVREIYALNDRMPVVGLRSLVRHTGTGQPHHMPLTEDWLVEFSRFFPVGTSAPQMARRLGPHIARPFGFTDVQQMKTKTDGMVLKDLLACTAGGLRPVSVLLSDAQSRYPEVMAKRFGAANWERTIRVWLRNAGLEQEMCKRLASDPPLTLYLMLEAEADTGGRTLGALGSIIMGENLASALPVSDSGTAVDTARAEVFPGGAPGRMAEVLTFLQNHYKFSDGAELVARTTKQESPHALQYETKGGNPMLDAKTDAKEPIPRVEVADYIEMGKLVAQWTADPKSRPETVADLKRQLHGIAVVPDRIEKVVFCQASLDTFVMRLPAKEMLDESVAAMLNPEMEGSYPLPQFYEDFYRPGFSPVLTPFDLLMARVGDYTIAQCK